MNKLFFKNVPFPHVELEIIDNSKVAIPASTTGNTCTALVPVFAKTGPDDRSLCISSVSQLTSLYGNPKYKKHGLTLKTAVQVLKNGGKVIVRRLTDEAAKNANAVLNVEINKAVADNKIYYYLKDNKLAKTVKAGTVKDTDYFEIPLATSPTLSYAATSNTGIKTEKDARLITIDEATAKHKVPVYVLMRTGAGTDGNKTVATISSIKTLSNNKDNVFDMVLDYGSSYEDFKVNAVVDSRYQTTPLNILDVINKNSFQTKVVSSDTNLTDLDTQLVTLLTAYATDLGTAANAITNEIAKAKVLEKKTEVLAIKEMLEDGDIEGTSILGMFGNNTRYEVLNVLNENKIEEIKFANGTNGELLKGKFDWNMTASVDGESVKIYEVLMTKFFEGVTEPNIMDINLCPVDTIFDAEYPVGLKKTVAKFVKEPNRRDVNFVMNSTKVASVTDLKSLDEGLKLDNYAVIKTLGYCDVYDDEESKTLNLPVSFFAIKSVCNFYTDGWFNPPLSGRIVEGPIEGSLTPVINAITLEADKTYIAEHGWNMLNYTKLGYQIDGQKTASTNPNEVSILQEYHNEAIVGRIIKKVYDACNRNKHFIQKQKMIDKYIEVVNKELEEFAPKVASLKYGAYYKDKFEEAEGLLTDYIEVSMYGTNKSHKIVLNVFRHSLVSE